MLDEPYRWLEAIENRREYIEERLRAGSPVVGLSYEGGILLLTLTHGEPKVFEIYDRMALSAIGHPADIEKLRMQLIDMAHLEGFSKSEADVTLHRLVNFGLIPLVKQAFDTVYESPFIVKLLAVELGQGRRPNQFYAVQYDGEVQTNSTYGVVMGSQEIDERVSAYVEEHHRAQGDLKEAFRVALQAWALGYALAQSEDRDEEILDASTLWEIAREQRAKRHLDAAVLDEHLRGNSKFRRLTAEEIESYVTEVA